MNRIPDRRVDWCAPWRGACAALLGSFLLCACSNAPFIPPPLAPPKPIVTNELKTGDYAADNNKTMPGGGTTIIAETPKPPPPAKLSTVRPAPAGGVAAAPEEANITVDFQNLPLPGFIQAVYGTILKKNFSVDPQVASRKDLVTLRAARQQTPSQIQESARLLLKSYGVAVMDLGADNYRIVPDNAQTGYTPEIRRGRALPEVPMPLRPVYQMVETQAVKSTEVAQWLNGMFGTKVKIQDDPAHSILLLSGQSDNVVAVLEAIQVLDQPLMKGRHSIRINPAFWSVDELAKKLSDLLQAEGYTASVGAVTTSPISMIPIQEINSLIVFSADPAVLNHITQWVGELDKTSPARSNGGGYFTYQVRFTNAEDVAKTLRELLEGVSAATAPPPSNTPIPANAVVIAGTPARKASRVVVNKATNTLIVFGNPDEYTQIVSLLQELDKPTKSALIEVTVAEVTLDDTTQLGVEWSLSQFGGTSPINGGTAGTPVGGGVATPPGLVSAGAGLTLARVSGTGELRWLVNALANNTHTNVLSSPRILARNGETATIQVGDSIPTITSQLGSLATTTSGTTGLLSSVQYIDTGIILKIKPTIYAGDRIDLDVSQEVSQPGATGVAGSPSISTRKFDTKLTLRDGAPVLLGGLMSQTNTATDNGVPLLMEIPVIGQLFKNSTDTKVKTELLVLITPYIVSDDHDAQVITEAFRNMLGPWAHDPDAAKVPPTGADKPPAAREPAAPVPPVSPPPAVPAPAAPMATPAAPAPLVAPAASPDPAAAEPKSPQ